MLIACVQIVMVGAQERIAHLRIMVTVEGLILMATYSIVTLSVTGLAVIVKNVNRGQRMTNGIKRAKTRGNCSRDV